MPPRDASKLPLTTVHPLHVRKAEPKGRAMDKILRG